tara:strand:- start:617 stop:718 length:102 start_codon:yes stop_codon:yes gene_type:complete
MSISNQMPTFDDNQEGSSFPFFDDSLLGQKNDD